MTQLSMICLIDTLLNAVNKAIIAYYSLYNLRNTALRLNFTVMWIYYALALLLYTRRSRGRTLTTNKVSPICLRIMVKDWRLSAAFAISDKNVVGNKTLIEKLQVSIVYTCSTTNSILHIVWFTQPITPYTSKTFYNYVSLFTSFF
jgi:hypothetical protein